LRTFTISLRKLTCMRRSYLLIAVLATLSCATLHPARTNASKAPRETLPERWIDLPEAPFFAALVGRKALLINRSKRYLNAVTVGCVREVEGRVSTLFPLFTSTVSEGGVRPGEHVAGLLGMVVNIDAHIAHIQKREPGLTPPRKCPSDAHVAVTAAGGSDGYAWTADGMPWPQ
jgi:hypothetical protein